MTSNIEIEILCPNCNCKIIIEQINCGIFRHGYLKSTFEQINPHLSKNECDILINNNLIYGCGKPFRIILDQINNTLIIEICNYI